MCDLARIVPPRSLISTKSLKPYETDGFHTSANIPLAVVLPETTEQVRQVMKYCHAVDVPVVPRGAGTSIAGGTVPLGESVLIGTSRMRSILDFDALDGHVRVQAGVTNLSVSERVRLFGWFYAPDPSSRRACTIGGNIGTNSGGACCLKHGVTTNNLLGVTIVLHDGEVLDFGGTGFDSPTYNLTGFVCGSEGQLGLVTEAILRLVRVPEHSRTVLLGFPSAVHAIHCASQIVRKGILPAALEFMDKRAVAICENFSHCGYPLDAEAVLIAEVDGSLTDVASELDQIIQVANDDGATTIVRSPDADTDALLWKGRNTIYSAASKVNNYHCLDCSVPLSQFQRALKRIDEIADYYSIDHSTVLHCGDGTVHTFLLYDADDGLAGERVTSCGDDIRVACVHLGGSISAEYGIGLQKQELLQVQYSRQDLMQQMRTRSAFDPDLRLNRGKVFPNALEAEWRIANC